MDAEGVCRGGQEIIRWLGKAAGEPLVAAVTEKKRKPLSLRMFPVFIKQ